MLGKIVKYYAIARAPKLAFSMSHPRKAARLVKTKWDLEHAIAPRVVGIAALLVALPVGYVLGRVASQRQPVGPVQPVEPVQL